MFRICQNILDLFGNISNLFDNILKCTKNCLKKFQIIVKHFEMFYTKRFQINVVKHFGMFRITENISDLFGNNSKCSESSE